MKIYPRKLHSKQMFGLMMLYRITGGNTEIFIHFQKEITSRYIAESECADFPKLRFWGLIEKKEGEREDGNPNTGYWRITQQGIDFIKDKSKVYSIAKIFNNQFYGHAGTLVSFGECAGNNFDYSDLMN